MTHSAKKQTNQHVIDTEGQLLLRQCLPTHWVLRDYRPDYGLDFALETFAQPSPDGNAAFETLGEHIFIQLKSARSIPAKTLELFARDNVEKQREVLDKANKVGALETLRFPLETSELITVERMGVGVPVLLVIADLARSKCFFVCLNDYIDKILVPRHENYRTKAHRTVHVPLLNEISQESKGLIALRWYAKRAKLYAAFQRFTFQYAELGYARGSASLLPMAGYFASRIASYDFWDDTELWALISYCGRMVRLVVNGEDIGLKTISEAAVLRAAQGDVQAIFDLAVDRKDQAVMELWRQLALLSRSYEDVNREWFLPTSLGYLTSFT